LKKAILLGAGGHAREIRDWAEQTREIQVVAFFDEHPKTQLLDELPVHSDWSVLNQFDFYIFAVGSPELRAKFLTIAQGFKAQPLTVIHPTVVMGRKVTLAPGTVCAPHVVITTNVNIGKAVLLNYGCTVAHDCELGDFVTVGPGANISGGCSVGDLSWIGANTSLKQYTAFPSHSTLGMGATWINSEKQVGTYIGTPAKLLVKKN
jgi:sugar O-acyltransferase (sialic acid O-acetyltransferase NeuD family)